jgi:hypothetical protein
MQAFALLASSCTHRILTLFVSQYILNQVPNSTLGRYLELELRRVTITAPLAYLERKGKWVLHYPVDLWLWLRIALLICIPF